MDNLEVLAFVGALEEINNEVSKKASEWGQLLVNDLEKVAEVYDESKKEDNHKLLKAVLGVGALGAGLALGLRGRSNVISERTQQLTENTKLLRTLGKDLNAVGLDIEAKRNAFFESHFMNEKDPWKKRILINTTKDIENHITNLGKNVFDNDSKQAMAEKIKESLFEIEQKNELPIGAINHLRKKTDSAFKQRDW